MRRRIPSIEALIAFECAARHESFTRSADELCLTQSAVSRQVACLEEYLGVPLFNRVKKRLSLTDIGRIYAKQVREHLERIERDTLAAMARRGAGGILELAVIPTFATRWLIPRLPQFYAQHPEITLNLTTRAEPFMFNDTIFDAAIHFGSPAWPGAVAHHLFGEEMMPVCSPRLMQGRASLRAAELAALPLLHQSARAEAWRNWFVQAGVHDVPSMKGQRYELFSMLVEAARAGLGVALMPRILVLGELASGQLVIPCDIGLRNEKSYFLVYPEYKAESLPLKVFRQWLMATARQYSETDRPVRRAASDEPDYVISP
ncbi:MAG TPA: transcriptional regulator GcvA [Noviherbaspirillum sp.]|uniref:transcriptional regulator GcvA n=1 Tax=Noviherbaspirillum sp. TaxID=1926288 RepID=UPI002D6B4751|nr:transcriptional regulator GcvA [Noviherbaspirillum sp.]HYD94076.1 transcriptional regulator GcvA [Noviherbaspirillum sp.]